MLFRSRAGLAPEAPALLDVAELLRRGGLTVAGVLTHCGASYHCHGDEALRAMAEQERAGAVRAAERLRVAGHAAPVVSVGSTPTALSTGDIEQLIGRQVGTAPELDPGGTLGRLAAVIGGLVRDLGRQIATTAVNLYDFRHCIANREIVIFTDVIRYRMI